VAAETGHLELAYDYLGETALIDLNDLQLNTRNGLHMAALAGTWIALVAGFGGMRDHDGKLTLAPRLPQSIHRLAFNLRWRGSRLRVEVAEGEASYVVTDGGQAIETWHHGQALTVTAGQAVRLPIPSTPDRPRPPTPPGRAPARRRPSG
jgi:alpha,alpha-trehalose phosphorylase